MSIPHDIEAAALIGWRMYPRAPRHRAAAFDGAAQQATCDLDTLARWATEFPGSGWYAVTGPSGVFAIDVDAPPKADGIATMRALTERHGPLPHAPMIRTGGGGWCIVFRHDGEPLIGRSGALGPGIDPRRGAQTITLPPTLHHVTGRPYRWLTAPWSVSPPTAPAWLLAALKPPPEPVYRADPAHMPDRAIEVALYRALDRVTAAGEGRRNDTLNRSSYRLANLAAAGRIARRDAERLLLEAASRVGIPIREARATIASAFRAVRA